MSATALARPIAPPDPATARTPLAAALAAADAAGRRIAPVWPLATFVAVNPYLGLAGRRFGDAASIMAREAGARMTMPRAFYLDMIEAGRITAGDLAAALAELGTSPNAPASVPALLAAARAGDGPVIAPLPTVADLVGRLDGRDWAGFVLDRLGLVAAEQFDEGQAPWASPLRADGLYAAWRETATIDRAPEIAGLSGFRATAAALPADAGAVLAEAARRLGLAGPALEAYFHRLLASIGGWAAYARCRLWQAELGGGSDGALRELLAARVGLDLVMLELFAGRPGFAEAWREAARRFAEPVEAGELLVDAALQTAFDRAWQRELADRLAAPAPARAAGRKAAQAAFCIDVRSEVFRRNLEAAAPDVETVGFAGFFGFPIEYVPLGNRRGGAQCPVLLSPKFRVCEGVAGATREEEAEILGLRLIRRRFGQAWKAFKLAAVSSFAYVETVGVAHAGKLATDALGWSRPAPHPMRDGIGAADAARLGPRVEPGELAGRSTGFSAAERLDMAEAVLRAMSMTGDFARIVLLVGHGSTTVNNPHASGLDCGACGGHTGEANARVAAAILNDPAVRAGLPERGIDIPADTLFLGALHDTTTDEVRVFEPEDLPRVYFADLERLKAQLAEGGRRARAERALRLGIDGGRPVDAEIAARAADWAQVRPEWGLAGCAAFIAAPRGRTAGRDLGGRAFLHSYAWRQDEGFGTLELIMTAPMVVASWISLQYYGSVVDNRAHGSGDKTLHNVVGTIGVLEGQGGDLRTGLPWQSVHDGERLAHEPLRLSVVIEAPREAMDAVIARHAMVGELVENRWLYLFAMDEDGRMAWRREPGGRWSAVEAG